MADNETITNGVNADSSESSEGPLKHELIPENAGSDEMIRALREDVERLEREKAEVTAELDEIRGVEIDRLDIEKRAMESITKRAFELEGEVVRLQHDLVTAMNAGEESSREAEELRKEIEVLRREKASFSEQLTAQVDELKRLKWDSEAKIVEMEKRAEELKVRESEARREKLETEERAREKLAETEKAVHELRKEKDDVEESMYALQAELKMSEKKVQEMERKVALLVKNSAESEALVSGLVEKASHRGVDGLFAKEEGTTNKKLQFPLGTTGAVVSTGVVVAAALAICYVRYSRTN